MDAVDPVSEDLLFAFGGLNKGLRSWVRACVAAAPGVTIGRADVMIGLMEKTAPVSMSTLGAAQDLSPRAMTVLVNGLEREGLIERTTDPADRRVSLISLTAAGRALAAEQLRPARNDAAALFTALPETDRAELLRLLHDVAAHLRDRGIDVPARPTS